MQIKVFRKAVIAICCRHTFFLNEYVVFPGRRGALQSYSNGLLEMCRWMESYFHDSTDYNFPSIFNRVTRMGPHVFGTLRVSRVSKGEGFLGALES